VFPNPEALLRLARTVLIEAHDEWQTGDRRYLAEGSWPCSPHHQPAAVPPNSSPRNRRRCQPINQQTT
jgi:hypothetical protein